MIDFSQKNLQPMIELGKKDGAKALQMGEGRMFELLEQYVNQSDVYKAQNTFNSFL